MIAQRRYEPAGFRLPLGLKDVRLALAQAHAVNVGLPFGSVLEDLFLDAPPTGRPTRTGPLSPRQPGGGPGYLSGPRPASAVAADPIA